MAWSAFKHNRRFVQYSISKIATLLSIDQRQEKSEKGKKQTKKARNKRTTSIPSSHSNGLVYISSWKVFLISQDFVSIIIQGRSSIFTSLLSSAAVSASLLNVTMLEFKNTYPKAIKLTATHQSNQVASGTKKGQDELDQHKQKNKTRGV